MKTTISILSILSVFLLNSCNSLNRADFLLTKAQNIIETNPDSTIVFLDSIIMPEKCLSKEKYMEYLVTKVQAKYKNYDIIKEDTNIFEAKVYFNKKAHRSKLSSHGIKFQMYANLYSGCVYDEQCKYNKALNDYKTAFTIAESIPDSLYMLRINNYIGELFSKQTYWTEALNIYRGSINLGNNNIEKAESYADVSEIHYINNQIDSSLFYIQKAIKTAEATEDRKIQSQIYQNAHIVYKACDSIALAWKYLNMAIEKDNDTLQKDLYNLNILSFYLNNDIDSARLYVNKLRKNFNIINDKYLKASICDAFTDYYITKSMYDSALYFQKELTHIVNDISKLNTEQNIYDIQKKYNHELQRNIYQSKLNKRLLLTICMLIILLLVSIISFIIITKSKHREKMLTKEVEDLSNVKNDYDKFKHEIKESFDNSLKERFNIIRKVNIFERNNKTNKNIKDIKEYAYGSPYKTAFDASVDVIESSYNKITSFIKKSYPELNETEYKICLLSIVPISTDDIANIVELGSDSVRKSRSNIRKKLNIEDKKTTISRYILEKYYNSNI